MNVVLQVGVKVFLKNPDGKYLLLHRSEKFYPGIPDAWDIPGGRIEPGIRLEENLARELQEEIQLSMNSTPRLIAAQDILRGNGRHVVRLAYVADTAGTPALNEEHSEYRWLNVKEMLAMSDLDRYTREVLESGVLNKPFS